MYAFTFNSTPCASSTFISIFQAMSPNDEVGGAAQAAPAVAVNGQVTIDTRKLQQSRQCPRRH